MKILKDKSLLAINGGAGIFVLIKLFMKKGKEKEHEEQRKHGSYNGDVIIKLLKKQKMFFPANF